MVAKVEETIVDLRIMRTELTVSLEPLPYGGASQECSVLMQGAGAWSCLNLLCQALLIPMGDLAPSEWRWEKSE